MLQIPLCTAASDTNRSHVLGMLDKPEDKLGIGLEFLSIKARIKETKLDAPPLKKAVDV